MHLFDWNSSHTVFTNRSVYEGSKIDQVLEKIFIASIIWLCLTVSNVLAFVSFTKTRITRKTYFSGYYLLAINISCLSVVMVIIPFNIVHYISASYLPRISYYIINLVEIFSLSIVMTTTSMMILERYLTVADRMRRVCTISKMKTKLLVSITWSLINILPKIFFKKCLDDLSCFYLEPNTYISIYLTVSIYFIPVMIISYCCLGISRTYSTRSALLTKRKKTHTQFIEKLLLQLFFYLLFNLPLCVMKYLYDVTHEFNHNVELLFIHLKMLSWLSYLVHPILYDTYLNIGVRCHREHKKGSELRRASNISTLSIIATVQSSSSTYCLHEEYSKSAKFNSCDIENQVSFTTVDGNPYELDEYGSNSDEDIKQKYNLSKARNSLVIPNENESFAKRMTRRFSLFRDRRRSSDIIVGVPSEDDLFNPYLFDAILYQLRKHSQEL